VDKFTVDKVSEYLMARLMENAPVREHPLGATKYSPTPGNLRDHGMNITKVLGNRHEVVIGNDNVIYAVWTEHTSHRKGWIAKSIAETVKMMIITYGGRIK